MQAFFSLLRARKIFCLEKKKQQLTKEPVLEIERERETKNIIIIFCDF